MPTARRGDARAPGRNGWDDLDGTDEEIPPWAGPNVSPRWADQETRQHRKHAKPEPGPAGPGRDQAIREAFRDDPDDGAGWDSTPLRAPEPRGPGFRSQRAAARSRRRSRFYWVWGGAAVAVAVVVVAVLLVMLGGSPAPKQSAPGLVTTFQKGELRTVPDTCTAVAPATLSQYLPGKPRVVVPHSLDGSAQSLCNWTLDAAPVYRVLEVNAQAYAPSALASGDGSATFAAEDAYRQALRVMQHPAKNTHLPVALVTTVPRLGTAAFSALQVVRTAGDSTDLETVVVRDHNVVVTVVFQGPHSRSGRYGPVKPSLLQAGAIAAATDIVSRLH
jgi:hypothetical protein